MMKQPGENLKSFVLAFIRGKELGVLSTVSADGQPQAATVGLYVDDSFIFMILTKRNSRKIENIKQNNKVALVIGTTEGLHTVQIHGTATILYPGDEAFSEHIMKVSAIKPLYYGPLLKLEGSDYVIILIKSNWVRWLQYNSLTKFEEFVQVLDET